MCTKSNHLMLCITQCDQKKIAKYISKVPKNDFTRKIKDFDIFTKFA